MEAVLERKKSKPLSTNGFKSLKNGVPHGIRWTVDEYYKMYDAGLFQGRRVQLIGGEIIEMAPMGTPHSTAIRLVLACLKGIFGDGFLIDSQLPLRLGKQDEPEPDIYVVKGEIRDFLDNHPITATLVVEIADSSLKFDRGRKVALYAENHIAEYWIVNFEERQLEVYRKPSGEGGSANYAEKIVVSENDSIAPLSMPKSKIKVADMLP